MNQNDTKFKYNFKSKDNSNLTFNEILSLTFRGYVKKFELTTYN